MMSFLCFITLISAPWTAYLCGTEYAYSTNVHLHGLISIAGFGYAGFLSLMLDKEYKRLSKTALILTLLLLVSIIINDPLMLTVSVVLQIIFLIMLLFKIKTDIFTRSAIPIAISAWVYFIYSYYFSRFGFIETKFSYSLLALSFPFSLVAFSKIFPLLSVITQWSRFLIVLVASVLLMFAGVLFKMPIVEGFFAAILIGWICYAIYSAYASDQSVLVPAFCGLMITGLLGGVYLFRNYHAPTLMWHAHSAYMLWAITAYYLIYFDIKDLDRRTVFCFLLPLFSSFIFLGLYFTMPVHNIFMTISVALFSFMALFAAYRRFKNHAGA